MDRDLAILLSSSFIRCAAELGEMVYIMGIVERDEDIDKLKSEVSRVIYDITSIARENIYQNFPDVGDEIERRLDKYSKAF